MSRSARKLKRVSYGYHHISVDDRNCTVAYPSVIHQFVSINDYVVKLELNLITTMDKLKTVKYSRGTAVNVEINAVPKVCRMRITLDQLTVDGRIIKHLNDSPTLRLFSKPKLTTFSHSDMSQPVDVHVVNILLKDFSYFKTLLVTRFWDTEVEHLLQYVSTRNTKSALPSIDSELALVLSRLLSSIENQYPTSQHIIKEFKRP